jgi:DUF2892 family protein
MKREHNVGMIERWIRIVGGGGVAVVGLALLLGGPGNILIAIALGALTLLGVDFVVTGITGYCPLYHWLGLSTVRHTPHDA